MWPPTQWAVVETDSIPHVVPIVGFETRGVEHWVEIQDGHVITGDCPCSPEFRVGDEDHRDVLIHHDLTGSSQVV